MSKVLPFVAGSSAKSQVVDAANKVLGACGVSLKSVQVSEAGSAIRGNNGVGLAAGLSQAESATLRQSLGLHSKVIKTATGASLNPDTIYNDSKFVLVRSFGPSTGEAVSSVERLDKFHKVGIDTAAEVDKCTESFKKTAEEAVKLAKELGASKVTVVQKSQSAFKEHNAIFISTLKSVTEPAGLSVEVQSSQSVTNNAVMFTKSLGVVVTPDYTVSDNLEGIAIGVSGGKGLASTELYGEGATIYAQEASANPTGLLVSAASALKQLGMTSEAGKIEKALKKAYSGKDLPADVKGGKATPEAFAKAISAAL